MPADDWTDALGRPGPDLDEDGLLPEHVSPAWRGYRGGFGTLGFPDGLDRDDDLPSLADC